MSLDFPHFLAYLVLIWCFCDYLKFLMVSCTCLNTFEVLNLISIQLKLLKWFFQLNEEHIIHEKWMKWDFLKGRGKGSLEIGFSETSFKLFLTLHTLILGQFGSPEPISNVILTFYHHPWPPWKIQFSDLK